VAEGVANSFLEGQEADGLLDATEGDVQGVEVFGLTEEAIEADFLEVQFVQDGGLMGLMFPVVMGGQGLAEMLEVAGEGRGGQAVLGGQGTQGQAVHQGLVDLRPGGVSADGTAGIHGFGVLVLGFGFWIKESGERLSGQGPKGQHGWEKWQGNR